MSSKEQTELARCSFSHPLRSVSLSEHAAGCICQGSHPERMGKGHSRQGRADAEVEGPFDIGSALVGVVFISEHEKLSGSGDSSLKKFAKLISQENNHSIDLKSGEKFPSVRGLENLICLAHQKED